MTWALVHKVSGVSLRQIYGVYGQAGLRKGNVMAISIFLDGAEKVTFCYIFTFQVCHYFHRMPSNEVQKH